jgi:hypothetical protein
MSEDGMARRLGEVGIWTTQLRSRDQTKVRDVAQGLEELGFGALWAPGGWAGTSLPTWGWRSTRPRG